MDKITREWARTRTKANKKKNKRERDLWCKKKGLWSRRNKWWSGEKLLMKKNNGEWNWDFVGKMKKVHVALVDGRRVLRWRDMSLIDV